jgi:molybdopterin converting factor small subunit
MEIKVLFFGVLAEVTGTSCKHYPVVNTMKDLRQSIIEDFPEIVHYNYRIALNNDLIDGEPSLRSGDEVAFLPPFAGG